MSMLFRLRVSTPARLVRLRLCRLRMCRPPGTNPHMPKPGRWGSRCSCACACAEPYGCARRPGSPAMGKQRRARPLAGRWLVVSRSEEHAQV